MRTNIIMAALFAASMAVPLTANAAVVYDAITVYDASDNVVGGVSATPADVAANPDAVFYVPGIAVDPSEFGNYSIVENGGVAVDIVGLSLGGPDLYDLAFGPGEQAAQYAVQNVIDATGAPINLTIYLDPGLQADGYTAYFTASGDIIIPSVPEASTWMTMIVGLGAVGAFMRRRQHAILRHA